MGVALHAEPLVFPAYVGTTSSSRGTSQVASKLPCLPVQKGAAPLGVWVVVQSIQSDLYCITVDAATIVPKTVLLSGVKPTITASGAHVTQYQDALYALGVRFPAPYATTVARMVRATGSYLAGSSNRPACFRSAPLPTCT